MRPIGLLLVVACSPAPPELLHTPKPLPGRCKSYEQIGALEQPILDASKGRRDTALEKFVVDRKLVLTGEKLPTFHPTSDPTLHVRDDRVPDPAYVYRAIEKATYESGAGKRDVPFVVDLGRPAWSQAIVDLNVFGQHPCGDSIDVEYLLAHDPTGAAVAVRAHTSRRVVEIGDKCGECSVGCGFPGMHTDWEAVVLPIATGAPVRIERVEIVEDEVRVRCEHEIPAI